MPPSAFDRGFLMSAIDLQSARRALASSRVEGVDAALAEWTELTGVERRGELVVATLWAGIPAAGLR